MYVYVASLAIYAYIGFQTNIVIASTQTHTVFLKIWNASAVYFRRSIAVYRVRDVVCVYCSSTIIIIIINQKCLKVWTLCICTYIRTVIISSYLHYNISGFSMGMILNPLSSLPPTREHCQHYMYNSLVVVFRHTYSRAFKQTWENIIRRRTSTSGVLFTNSKKRKLEKS